MRVRDLRSPELAAAIADGAVALWPIGSTEAHGPHLPLGTDAVIAEETCARVMLPGLHALIFPTLSFTLTDFAAPFSGTVTLPRDTVLAYVRDVTQAIAVTGVRAVCLVNAHLEPAHRFMLRDAVKAARATAAVPVGLADPADARWARSLGDEFASGSCHAGQYETSLVLAATPGLVDRSGAAALPPLAIDLVARIKGGARDFREAGAPDAYCGTPADASIPEGEARYARLAEIVNQVVAELLSQPGGPA